MFTKPIYASTLTSETADRLFPDITSTGALDSSFLATMRALLHKRVQKNEPIRLVCKSLNLSEAEILSATTSQAMGWFIPENVQNPDLAEHTITIIYTTNQDSGKRMLEIIRSNSGLGRRYLSGYTLCEDLHIFYASRLNALFYQSETENSTVIFTDKLELKQFHALQMTIPRYLPSLFKDSPLSEQETLLLKSLGNKSAADYERLIEEFARNLDIRTEIIRTKLAGFETAFERMRLSEIKDEIYYFERDYENYLNKLRELTNKIQDKKCLLAGLECAINERSGDSELMEYFMCNKNLSIINVSGTTIEFVVHGYADIYDVDAFELYVGNHGGYMYSMLNNSITKSQMEKLYRAIFSENRYKLRFCAAYSVDIRSGLRAISDYIFPLESESYLPNPHIQEYGCIGSYAARFQEYMQKRDYVGAIDQAVVSARNLNFYDSTVVATFARNLSHADFSCIEKPDGTLITPIEAIKNWRRNYVKTNYND